MNFSRKMVICLFVALFGGAKKVEAFAAVVKKDGENLPVEGDPSVVWEEIPRPDGLADVRASRFLRPYSPRLQRLEPLRVRRITKGIEAAAREGRVYHLWWHPHNFGIHLDENLKVLGQIIDAFDRCRQRDGMESLTMAEAADRARAYAGQAPPQA